MGGLLPSILMREVNTGAERAFIFVLMYIIRADILTMLLNDFCKGGELEQPESTRNRVPG